MKNNLNIEIISPDKFEAVIAELPNPNEIISDKVSFYSLIDEMMLDSKIGSHLRLRKDIVTSFNFVIEQKNASDKVYEFVRDNLTSNLNWDNDVKEFLTAIEYGFAFSEVLWAQNDAGYWIPDSLRNKRPEQIFFKTEIIKTKQGQRSIWVPMLTKENRPLIEKCKFLIYRNSPRAENPYGFSDLLMCYWPWRFKQFGWEFWLKAAKKAGVPSIVALFESTNTEEARNAAQAISQTLSEMEGGAGLALSNVKDIKTLEMSGALQDHKVLIETCNQEISFALTTQSLSTQEGTYGTRSQAEVHDENLVRVCHGDAKAVQGVFQELINWMVAINFGEGVAAPSGYFDLKSYATFTEIMQAIQNKIPVSKEALYTRYGLPRPKDDEDTFIVEAPQAQGFMLADSNSKKKNSKQQITRKNILADEKEKSSELESFCDAGKKRFDECISKTLKQALKDVFNVDKTLEKNELKSLVKNISYPESSAELIKLTEKIIAGAFLLGFNHAGITLQKKDVNLADGISYTSAVEPLPFEEAIGFLKSKISIEKQVWEALEPKFRFRAFTVARLSECDHIEAVRKRLIQALEKGEGWQESWEEIESFTKNIRKPFLPGYWETVYRTNVQTAYTAGRLTQYASNPPYAWELLVIQDGRTTDICNNIASIAGNGKALKADHPFWTVYGFPPYHFNCRTTIRAVYDYEAGAGTNIVEPSIDEIKKDFMPQEGFGGNPIEKESWWKIPPNLIERADKYGITNDIIAQANELGMQSYFPELLQGYDIAYTGKNGGYVHVSKNWEYSEKEMQSAKRLADLGHTIYFLPRTYKTSSPDMIIDNEIGEMKHIITLDRKSIRNHIKRSGEQGAEIVYINIRSDKQKNRLFEIIKDEIKNIPMKSLLVDMNGNIERYERNFFTK